MRWMDCATSDLACAALAPSRERRRVANSSLRYAQSIVVASTATNWYGHEGEILRYVFFHSLALAALVGLLVFLQAAVPPFSGMVVR